MPPFLPHIDSSMSSLHGLSASVTRILSLTGFPKELKTKDIQAAFSEWENVNGGFKIKWRDDISLLLVFQDAAIAKRAYLQTVAFPPAVLTSASTGISATIKPYDGPDAQSVIQNVNARTHQSNPSRSHNARSQSISVFPSNHGRGASISGPPPPLPNGNGNGHMRTANGSQSVAIPHYTNGTNGREPSPTLPSLPTHPTLNSLISSSLGEAVARDAAGIASSVSDPAILATSLHSDLAGGPRIGDPGKRMMAAALGVKHPSLGGGGGGGGGKNGAVESIAE